MECVGCLWRGEECRWVLKECFSGMCKEKQASVERNERHLHTSWRRSLIFSSSWEWMDRYLVSPPDWTRYQSSVGVLVERTEKHVQLLIIDFLCSTLWNVDFLSTCAIYSIPDSPIQDVYLPNRMRPFSLRSVNSANCQQCRISGLADQ